MKSQHPQRVPKKGFIWIEWWRATSHQQDVCSVPYTKPRGPLSFWSWFPDSEFQSCKKEKKNKQTKKQWWFVILLKYVGVISGSLQRGCVFQFLPIVSLSSSCHVHDAFEACLSFTISPNVPSVPVWTSTAVQLKCHCCFSSRRGSKWDWLWRAPSSPWIPWTAAVDAKMILVVAYFSLICIEKCQNPLQQSSRAPQSSS